jgi:glycosyltransferase 2 family protein
MLLRPAIISAVAATLLYALAVAFSGHRQILAAIQLLGPEDWGVILGLSVANYTVRAWRWHLYIIRLGHRLPFFRHIFYYWAGLALTATPGKAGENVRAFYLKPYGVGYGQSLAAFVAERYMDLVAVGVLALLVFTHFKGYEWAALVAAALVVSSLWLVRGNWLSARLASWAAEPQQGRLRSLAGEAASMLDSAAVLLRSRLLLIGFAASLLGWGAEAWGFYYTVGLLGSGIEVELALGIYGASVLAGVVSFLPGGIGGTEAAMMGLLVWAGAEAEDALAATLICRVATLWFAVGWGAVVMGIIHFGGLAKDA